MAGLSNVLDAVLKLASDALYPGGQTAGQSAVGFDVVLGVGWPDDAELQATVNAGKGFVSVYPLPGERAVTAWEYDTQEVPRPPVGIQATRRPDTAIYDLAGVSRAGDVIGVAHNGRAYTLALQEGQDAAAVADALFAILPPATIAGRAGGIVSFNYAPDLDMRTGSNGYAMQTLDAIQRRVQLTVWGFDQPSRNVVYDAIAVAVQQAHFLNVPMLDGAVTEAVRISYDSGTWNDKAQNAGGYMRGLIALVDFQTTVYQKAYTILFTDLFVNAEHFGSQPAAN